MIVACQWNKSSGEFGPDTWEAESGNGSAAESDNAEKAVEGDYKPS